MTTQTIITLDLGATKCAAGIILYDTETHVYQCQQSCHILLSDTLSLLDLIRQIETKLSIHFREADAICVGAAGQYNGVELCHLDGVYPYPMRFAEIAQQEGWRHYAVIHDYDTVVCATFTSYMQNEDNLLRLNDCSPHRFQRRVAIGLGTGLGMKDGVLMPNGNFWLGKNEGGHIGIPYPPLAKVGRLQQHLEYMQYLQAFQRTHYQQITLENVLTGRGLVHLHQFLYPTLATPTPHEISEKVRLGQANELLDLFAWYLGLFIGTIELMFMPEGGIWLTGGVVIKNIEIFQESSFKEGIEASPAYRHERGAYPLGVMVNPEHALIGGGFYAVHRLLVNKVETA